MTSALRISLGKEGVSIWSSELFGDTGSSRVRDFLSRAFAVEEVEGVELRRARSFGKIRYGSAVNPAQIWRKLSRALGAPERAAKNGVSQRADAGLVYLDGPSTGSIRVSRVGRVLSTWQVRERAAGQLRLSHPALRNRRDVIFRLEEELAALFGVEDFRVNALTARVSIRFDVRATSAERIALELEKAWPRLLGGLDGPPSRTRLFVSTGLVGLAYTGQYLVPAVRPFAVAGVALYSFPNVINAGKQLTRGQVGVSALYTAGLGFMLVSGMPFTASVMASFMQLWPHLARRKAVRSQRRLFAAQRRVPSWARLVSHDGSPVDVHVDDLRAGDLVVVSRGETVAADGRVTEGAAAVVDPLAPGGRVEDRAPGDAVSAGTLVLDGSLTIRVERAGALAAASIVASLLPHSTLPALPASEEAERIANRNAKPALALAALTLLLTRTPLPAQAVLRPDYLTGPRLGAQLSALLGVAAGAQAGVFFRNPAALDRLNAADVYVLDDSAGLEHPSVEVATVQAVSGVPADLVVSHALATQRHLNLEQATAVAAFAKKRSVATAGAASVQRRAGVIRFDAQGRAIEVVTSHHLAALGVSPPAFATRLVRRRAAASVDAALAHDDAAVRPLWVLQDGVVIGVISFTRTGEIAGRRLVRALAERSNQTRKPARVLLLSSGAPDEARALAARLGIEARGGLSGADKGEIIRGLGRSVLWVGDGSHPDARGAIAASAVSLSVAPLERAGSDVADVLLPHRQLSGLTAALDIGGAHAARLTQDYRIIYGANLLSVAGAFLAAFNTLNVALLTNLGTGLIYARHAMYAGLLANAAEQRQRRLKRAAASR